jgi:tRNA modification GTPase
MNAHSVHVSVLTAPSPGAIAVVQLCGPGVLDLLHRITGTADWPAGRMRLVDLAGIDSGMAVLLRDGPEALAQIMPHGGPRVVQKILAQLLALGATYAADLPPRTVYPEADSDLEADMLATLARAASPAAVDLLLAQPALWRESLTSPSDAMRSASPAAAVILARARVLDRLITPPTVVVVGQPNVGKSTLTNRVLGRAASLVADLPGTTRDWVAGLAELVTPTARGRTAAVAVRWLDTPGFRPSEDAIEQQAIRLARQVILGAEVVIALRDPVTNWPEAAEWPRIPDLWVMNKCDMLPANTPAAPAEIGARPDAPLRISAVHGTGLELLQHRILELLGLVDLAMEPWAFSAVLKSALETCYRLCLIRYAGLTAI